MNTKDPIADVVGRAHRRALVNRAAAALAFGACFAAGAAIVVMVLGTSLINFWWVAAVGAASSAVALWRGLRSTPRPYAVAQVVDAKLGLHDALSTALYFSESGVRSGDAAMIALQRDSALAAAASADPAAAIPFVRPRHAYLLGALALGFAGLGILRFGIERKLDLSAPITEAIFDTITGQKAEKRQLAKNGGKRDFKGLEAADADTGTEEEHPEEPGVFDPAREEALQTIEVPEVDNSKAEASPKGNNQGDSQQAAESQSPDAEQNPGAEQGSSPSDSGGETPGVSKGMKPEKGNQPPNAATDGNSLSAKLQDAFQNLLSTLKPKSSSQGQQGKPQQGDQQEGQQEQASGGQKGAAGQGQQQASNQSGEGQEAEGDDSQQADASKQAQASGKGNSDQSSQAPGSGMGKQDGSKDVKMAEQLAAMGKISEIIGKRSLTISGETTLEVQQSKQQLRTNYSQSKAGHALSGGEVNRDEVPAAAQEYIQRYFEKVRPSSAPARRAGQPAKPDVPAGDKGER